MEDFTALFDLIDGGEKLYFSCFMEMDKLWTSIAVGSPVRASLFKGRSCLPTTVTTRARRRLGVDEHWFTLRPFIWRRRRSGNLLVGLLQLVLNLKDLAGSDLEVEFFEVGIGRVYI